MIDTSAFQGKTAAYYTLGCKLNFSETSTFGRMLQYLQTNPRRCHIRDKGGRRSFSIEQVTTVTQALDILRLITDLPTI